MTTRAEGDEQLEVEGPRLVEVVNLQAGRSSARRMGQSMYSAMGFRTDGPYVFAESSWFGPPASSSRSSIRR